ncbi:MAG: hypothetical protein RI967_1512, partial [Planctomycetota bacterium]
WTQVFGRGLVETAENFGLQGSSPTHPALLDRLAREFASGEGAWDARALLRRFVLSATFRQRSGADAAKRAADPANELYARGPAVRLRAEELRDSAMLASGLLVERFGGPSVKPWQQPGLVADAGGPGGYAPGSGDDLHRRSLYTYRKRTVPPPTMTVFDAGSREACMPRRLATNTPLQALALLNDPVFAECADALAARAMREAEGRDARLVRAFRLACARAPREAELEALRALVARHAPVDGDGRVTEATERAALALATATILASDAFTMSR